MKVYLIIISIVILPLVLVSQGPPRISDLPAFEVIYGDFNIPEYASEGEVVSLHPKDRKIVVRSHNPYDPLVEGVIVRDSLGELRVAVAGEVDVLIDPSVRAVRAGDWLVASGATGMAMPIQDDFPFDAIVLGAALTGFSADSDSVDTVRVLLTPGERIGPGKGPK